jgi:hypothetical protein
MVGMTTYSIVVNLPKRLAYVMHTKFIVVCLVSNQLLMVGMTTYSIVVTLPKRMHM